MVQTNAVFLTLTTAFIPYLMVQINVLCCSGGNGLSFLEVLTMMNQDKHPTCSDPNYIIVSGIMCFFLLSCSSSALMPTDVNGIFSICHVPLGIFTPEQGTGVDTATRLSVKSQTPSHSTDQRTTVLSVTFNALDC
ncbi:hypothetical protein Btru_053894 [Bulinus truncatus]|nr:hypothetical protein Btru_053894 [Bulinus truncatus]